MSRSKHIARIAILTVISFIIGLKLYNWNSKTLVGNKLPTPFGYGFSVVLSGSMEPELSVNDFVIIKKQSSYKKNDIVVYQDGDSLVIHRLISIDDNTAVTKGDANDIADPGFSPKQIKGKMVFHMPYTGAVVRFLKSPVGTILLLLVAVLMFEMPYLREKKNTLAEQERIKAEIKRLKDE